MFPCSECGKSYVTQNSLDRHLNNHSIRTRGHKCPKCYLVFSRRDLMVRHKSIHERAPSTTRRRCHTACEPCRASHEKCDGANPCSICRVRKQSCTYRERSRRVSQPVSGSTGATGRENHPEGTTNNKSPQDNHKDPQKPPLEPTISENSPWSSTDNTLYQPPEFDIFAKSTIQQGNCTTNMMQNEGLLDYSDFALPDLSEVLIERTPPSGHNEPRKAISEHRISGQPTEFDLFTRSTYQQGNDITDLMQSASPLDGPKGAALSDYLDFILPDLSQISSEDDVLHLDHEEAHPTEFDVFAKSTQLQGTYPTDIIRTEGVNGTTSPNYSDFILPDLPDIPMDDLHPDHCEDQNAIQESSAPDATLCWGADNTPNQPAVLDFSASLFSSSDSTPYGSLLNLIGRRSEEGSIFQGARPPRRIRPSVTGQRSLTHSASPTRGDILSGSIRPAIGALRKDRSSKQSAFVRELVDYAIAASNAPPDKRGRDWKAVSTEVCILFGLTQPPLSQDCMLFEMVHLYKQNLLPLWPMVCEKDLEDPSSLNPVLFLVAVSAGAMYVDDHNASVFGTMIHQRLQTCLITSFIEKDVSESDTIWLAQARNTIQVAALYLGQRQALAYAQHLGSVLVSQSRRMDLFRRTGVEESSIGSSPKRQVAAWIWAETRRRVAFGILRADVFVSLLLNCPPNISAGELEISLPYPDALWLSIGKRSPEDLLAALERERMKRNETPFCDLIRIMAEREEVLLNMETRNYELLLFGLQEQVWKFSHDPDMFQRLIGRPWQDEEYPASLDAEMNRVFDSPTAHSRHHVQLARREMKDLILDRRRLAKALEKVSLSFNASRYRPGFNHDRGSILSSLLLFHIYHLQLNAPLDLLRHIADGICNKTTIDCKKLRTAIRWARNPQARNAIYNAAKIWSLLDAEVRMNPSKQPRYTMLSFMGLYHASVVLWACFGLRRGPDQLRPFAASNDASDDDRPHNRSSEILMSIVFLYSKLKRMSWDAFADSVRRLSFYQFPRDHP